MAYFDWTPDLDSGITLVDEQHKILVRCINELHEANSRKDFGAEGKIIEDLIRYTVEHFTDEERLMDEAGYPLSKQHKTIHQRFVDKVGEMQKSHQAGEDIGQELLDVLHSWLFTHISHHDRGFIAVVQSHLAKQQAENETSAAETAIQNAFAHPRHSGGGFATVSDKEADGTHAAAEEPTDTFAQARQKIGDLKIWR
ncbi:McHr [Kingella potus]|uniref:McHr n=1 Tax=Kingella potus TaxID=265175 RepID=A0A377R2V5_9NEIS|nr:bacteriohemerythrin [Kingella potus]UOO99983.1 bacteriohemerythrin [Kingella potus]STR03268.1 McHr [Kingella potus]